MAIYFSAKASLGLDDFDYDMPHFCQAVFFLDITESRQIGAVWGLIFHPSINRKIGLLTEVYAANLTPPTSFPEINRKKPFWLRPTLLMHIV
jgi:hypothetical protein